MKSKLFLNIVYVVLFFLIICLVVFLNSFGSYDTCMRVCNERNSCSSLDFDSVDSSCVQVAELDCELSCSSS